VGVLTLRRRRAWRRSVSTAAYGDSVITRETAAAFDAIDFAVVDVETTGWSPEEAGITEIGAVRVSGGRVRGEFTALVNPGRAIPPEIATLTGISDAMVALAPPITAVLPGFLDFARGCVLTAHNAPFDIGFLSAACGTCGLPWPACEVIDTVILARQVLGEDEVPNRKLSTLASFFGAGTPPCHRALADARATADVLAGLLRRLAAAGVRTLAEILAEITDQGAAPGEARAGGTLRPMAGGTTGYPAGS
jgi:DNA polymerase-3 subunit epsilon